MERAIRILEKAIYDIRNLPPFPSLTVKVTNLAEAEDVNLDNVERLEKLLTQVLILAKKEHKLWEKTYCKDLEK